MVEDMKVIIMIYQTIFHLYTIKSHPTLAIHSHSFLQLQRYISLDNMSINKDVIKLLNGFVNKILIAFDYATLNITVVYR